MKKKLKKLEKRIYLLERKKKTNKKNCFENIPMLIILYISMIIWFPVHLFLFSLELLIRPFLSLNKDIRKNKKYWINGQYNHFEYVWIHHIKK